MDIPKITPKKSQIKTEGEAINFVESLVRDMLAAREQCRMPALPTNPGLTVQMQKRAMWVFLTKQGQVTGALNALYAAGLISDRAYTELNNRAINSLAPDVVTI